MLSRRAWFVVLQCGLVTGCGSTTTDAAEDAASEDASDSADVADVFAAETEVSVDAEPEAESAVDAGSIALSSLKIEDNPTSVLSCFVSWTTTVPATTVVEFGEGTAPAFRVHDDALVTEHRIAVIGMHASTAHLIRAKSVDGSGAVGTLDGTYTTKALPLTLPAVEVKLPATAKALPGWTLYDSSVIGGLATSTAIAVDASGKAVWYRRHDSAKGPAVVTLVDGGKHVLLGAVGPGISAIEVDLAGNVVWTGPANPMMKDNEIHHEYRKLKSGNYAVLRHKIVGTVTGDVLQEMDKDGAPVWSWDAFANISPIASTGDWLHGNALDLDAVPGRAIYSAAELDTVFAIDRSTGKIVWRLGAGGSFAADPTAKEPWFRFQHDPEVLEGGHVLIYDNGNAMTRPWTRAVEYALDETTMKATIVWTYPPASVTDVWFTEALGSANRLSNGNTLITAGSVDAKIASRVFEVTPEGTKVFEFAVHAAGPGPAAIFRARRIPPMVESL